MKLDSFWMAHFPSKRGLFMLVAICVGVFLVMYPAARAQFATSRESLVDITEIESLRAQFNEDQGQVRLVILLNPT